MSYFDDCQTTLDEALESLDYFEDSDDLSLVSDIVSIETLDHPVILIDSSTILYEPTSPNNETKLVSPNINEIINSNIDSSFITLSNDSCKPAPSLATCFSPPIFVEPSIHDLRLGSEGDVNLNSHLLSAPQIVEPQLHELRMGSDGDVNIDCFISNLICVQ